MGCAETLEMQGDGICCVYVPQGTLPAAHLLSAGVPPHVVARRLGHSDVATTLHTYAAVLPQQREAAEKADAILAAALARTAGSVPEKRRGSR